MQRNSNILKTKSILPVILAVCFSSFIVCNAQQKPGNKQISKPAISFNYPCNGHTITIDLGTRKKTGNNNSFDLVLKCTNNTPDTVTFPHSLTVWNDTELKHEDYELIFAKPGQTVGVPLHFYMGSKDMMRKGGRMDVSFKDSTVTYSFDLRAIFVD